MNTMHTQVHRHGTSGSARHTGLFSHRKIADRSLYVRDDMATNGVESVFAALKRGLAGVYHQASKMRLGGSADAFAFLLMDDNDVAYDRVKKESAMQGDARGLPPHGLMNCDHHCASLDDAEGCTDCDVLWAEWSLAQAKRVVEIRERELLKLKAITAK
jgi:hypothetical protein